MSVCRILSIGSKCSLNQKYGLLGRVLCSYFQSNSLNQERNFRKAYGRFLKTMKSRRKLAGPGISLKRSEWIEWNYNAELYAFNKRLNENISDDNLRCSFVHESYIEMEKQSRKELEVSDVPLDLKSNHALVSSGYNIASNFINCYLRHSFKFMPENGISAVHDYLLSDNVLSYVSSHLGTKDLIFCSEYPPEPKTLADTLKAIIGAIAASDSSKRAECFVLDFICPQLIGKDIFEIWEIDNPLEILNGILCHQNCEPSESRLIFESGRNTIEAIYNVGLFSNKMFLGKGFGETLAFAEEMAAYDALRRIFKLNESMKPLNLGDAAKKLEMTDAKKHKSIEDLTKNTLSAENVS